MQKRVIAIHDISCVGKCSLTVALPVLSSVGIETSVLPTAVLSTHTGGFEGYTFRDLTEDIMPIAEHWKSLGLRADAIYTGYLGSFRQLGIVSGVIDMMKSSGTVVLIDPVMGDSGRLYASFTPDFALGMAKLCGKADIIVPNLTEAAYMLGRPYLDGGYSEADIEELLSALSSLGPEKVVISGVSFEKGKVGAASFDRGSGEYSYCFRERIPGYYHGTGDVFASALLAAYMNGKSLKQSIETAVDFVVSSVKATRKAGTDTRFGVDFEHSIPELIRAVLG